VSKTLLIQENVGTTHFPDTASKKKSLNHKFHTDAAFFLKPRALFGSRTRRHATHDLSLIQTPTLPSRLSTQGFVGVHASKGIRSPFSLLSKGSKGVTFSRNGIQFELSQERRAVGFGDSILGVILCWQERQRQ